MEETVREEIYKAFRKMREGDFEGASGLLRDGLGRAELEGDTVQEALFLSTFGVLHKLKGEIREAWRHYERAERLLPDDPALKIIVAKMLIEQFGQYDLAIKKAKGVLKIARGSPSFEHQAHTILSIAYLRKGDRKKAVEMFDLAMKDGFRNLITAENIDFDVVAAFLSRQFETERCRLYVETALELARRRKEEKPIRFLEKLLAGFDVTLSGVPIR